MPLPVEVQNETITIGGKTFHTAAVDVPGITTASIYTAVDALGTSWTVEVPASGVIHSVWTWDTDAEVIEFDILLFRESFTGGTDHDAFAPVEADKHKLAGPALVIDTFVTLSGVSLGGADNVGFPYTAPNGRLYGQVVTQGTPTYAAGKGLSLGFVILED